MSRPRGSTQGFVRAYVLGLRAHGINISTVARILGMSRQLVSWHCNYQPRPKPIVRPFKVLPHETNERWRALSDEERG